MPLRRTQRSDGRQRPRLEGWFPRFRGEHTRQRIAMRWDCTRTESSDRASRNGSAAARAEPRARSLNSRPPSQNGSRRPDRRIGGEWGSTSCAPTLWKKLHSQNSSFRRVWTLCQTKDQWGSGPYSGIGRTSCVFAQCQRRALCQMPAAGLVSDVRLLAAVTPL